MGSIATFKARYAIPRLVFRPKQQNSFSNTLTKLIWLLQRTQISEAPINQTLLIALAFPGYYEKDFGISLIP
jgi:hypothetical protein